ncbi:MAG TPA: glycoside hydrolase family protein [Caulobacteraceae bacterium]
MTTPFLAQDLRRDEGLRLCAYADPLTGSEPWTIGYGHTGPEVREGMVWTPAEAETALIADIARACEQLDAHIPWWRRLGDARQDVLANMVFNMGWLNPAGTHGLGTFHRTMAAIQAGRWQEAHDRLLADAWAREVGARARRLAAQMLTGARAPQMEPA